MTTPADHLAQFADLDQEYEFPLVDLGYGNQPLTAQAVIQAFIIHDELIRALLAPDLRAVLADLAQTRADLAQTRQHRDQIAEDWATARSEQLAAQGVAEGLRREVAKLRKIAPEFGDLGPIRWPCGRTNIHVPHDWFPERPVQCAGLDDPDET